MTTVRDLPAVTVVIPCFNQGRYLPAAIASVRRQRYARLECLVVDDGSTDETAALAAGLGASVLTQTNQGVAAARNAGLAAARGDFVVFLDADDELLPGAVAAELAAFGSPSGAAAVVGRCQAMDAAGRALPTSHHRVDAASLYREWLSRNFVWTPGAAMFRRDALEELGGFPVDLGPAADYAVYLRLSRADRVVLLSRDLVRYRQHDASMSRDPASMLRATLEVLRRERRDAPSWALPALRQGQHAWREWYGNQIIERLWSDWRAGRAGWDQARGALTLVRHCPTLAVRRAAGRSRRVLAGALRAARTGTNGRLPAGRRRAVR